MCKRTKPLCTDVHKSLTFGYTDSSLNLNEENAQWPLPHEWLENEHAQACNLDAQAFMSYLYKFKITKLCMRMCTVLFIFMNESFLFYAQYCIMSALACFKISLFDNVLRHNLENLRHNNFVFIII